MELLDQWLQRLDAQINLIRAQQQNFSEALVTMTDLFQGVFQEGRGRLSIFLEFWTQAMRDPEVWRATVAPFQRYWDFFDAMIRSGIENGSLRSTDTNTAARVIVALAVGLLVQGLVDPDHSDWGKISQEGFNILLKGLERS